VVRFRNHQENEIGSPELYMALDPKPILQCLDEVESELFRVADNDECQRFHKHSQLTAVLLLLLRTSSLLRSMTLLVQFSDLEDGFHLVARGFEETWNLAHDLRLSLHHDKAIRWLAGENDSWSARIAVLVKFAIGRGHLEPTLARDYGLLSELAHPTRSAAENSVTLCGVRMGIDGAEAEIATEQENCEKRVTATLYRLLWLVLDQDAKFIAIPVDENNMPVSSQRVRDYKHIDPET
jgi:hypothetical protein